MKKNTLTFGQSENKVSIRKLLLGALAVAVSACSLTLNAFPTSYYTANSKLSAGKWVKVKTSGEGIHEITYDMLREWGFSNPEKVNVYGYGSTLMASETFSTAYPDDIKLTYSLHEGNKLYFYSTGDVTTHLTSESYAEALRNYYSTDTYYLLSDREPASSEKHAAAAVRTTQTALNAHLSVQYVEEELQNPSEGGAVLLGKNISNENGIKLPVSIKNMGSGNTTWSTSTFITGFASLFNRNNRLYLTPPSDVTFLRHETGTGAGYAFDDHICYRTGTTYATFNTILPDGEYDFLAKNEYDVFFSAVDYTALIYPRLSRMQGQSQLSMDFPMVRITQNFSVEGPSTVRVANITSSADVFEHKISYDAQKGITVGSFDRNYNTSALPSCRLIAFDIAVPQKEVQFAGQVTNQNIHGLETPHMVIITTADLMDSAEELARIHRELDNMDVVVLEHRTIFNEFSSATPDIMGYRRLIKMFYDRDPEKFKYVIMYGPSVWDNRHLILDAKERLLIYETTDPYYAGNTTTSFASDSFLGMLNDNYNPSDIIKTRQDVAVGRIPVSDAHEAAGVNRKIRNYIEKPHSTSIFNTALIVSDDGDGNEHLDQAEKVAVQLANGHEAMTVVRAHNSLFPWNGRDALNLRSLITNTFNRGAGLFVYIGHGNTESFGAERLWNKTFIDQTSYDIHPHGFWGTCDPFGFDLANSNIGEAAILKEDGGLITLIAAGRTVYGPRNFVLAQSLMDAYLRANSQTTIGDLWLQARNNLFGTSGYDSNYQVNTMTYNLGGDPALRVNSPDYRVNASLICEDGTPSSITALSNNRIEGEITDAEGNLQDDFNGTVTLQLYDAPYSVNTLIRNKQDDVEATLVLDHDILMSKTVDIVNGKFSTNFVAPVPVHESDDMPNRLTFHADSDDGRRGDGLLHQFAIKAADGETEEPSGSAPVIENMALIQNGVFTDQVNINEPIHFIAAGSVDEVGLNNSTAIGAGSSLIIDGKPIDGAKEIIRLNDDDNTWTLNIALNTITPGQHSAILTISDNAGRRTTGILTFTATPHADIELTSDVSTIRDKVTFDVEHTLGTLTDSRLIIEDLEGNTVMSKQNLNFPAEIDFASTNLATGNYKAYIVLTGETGNGASGRIPLVYLKN